MKTGRPEYYIPSADTLSRDVKNVFVCVRGRIAKALKVGCAIFILSLEDSPSILGVQWQAQFRYRQLVIAKPQVIYCNDCPS